MGSEPESTPSFMQWEEVPSVVGSNRTHSLVARPTTADQCREVLAFARRKGVTVCPRGSGRSYADMALNDQQMVLNLSDMNRILAFDEATKQITVEGGTQLIQIFSEIHYRLLTLPASPTESHSSVAGALCANVNGKEAWRRGNFGEQVVRLALMTADGEIHEIDRSHEWFPAIVGGLGLLGIVLDVTLQLRPIPSPYVRIDRVPAANVGALLERMDEVEKSSDAAVVWVDAYARGKDVGRSVVHTANWLEREQTEEERRDAIAAGIKRLHAHRRFGLALHAAVAPLLSLMLEIQRPAMRALNRLYYVANRVFARLGRAHTEELFLRFNFEASYTVPPAYLVCGPYGFTIQITFPRSRARDGMVELLGICRNSPCPPVTTILRAHRADDHWISFSENGYSLNFEFHPKRRHRKAARTMVDRLFDATARLGGKVHLAKDQLLTPEQFRRLFPKHVKLSELKDRVDPDGLFASDLARRIGACKVVS